MSNFQLVLIGFGVVLVLGVILYNWLQERKYRQQVSNIFAALDDGPNPDELLATLPAERQEPQLRAAPPEIEEDEGPAEIEPVPIDDNLIEQEVEPTESAPEIVQAAPSTPEVSAHFEQESPLDAETEYIARLRFSQPVMAPVAALIEQARQFGKPVRVMGQQQDGSWEWVTGPSRNSYTALELGLQLADRSGAVTSGQIDTFCRLLYNFAAEQGGAVSCPDKYAALEVAAALDQFCIEVDVLIGLNIVAPDARPFLMSEVHRCAGLAGMALQADGTYAVKSESGRALYTLANQADAPFQPEAVGVTTHGVTLLFDVPSVADGLVVFERMADVAQRLGKSLGGRLVDDNGKLVSQETLQRIHQRLAEAYANMDTRGIPAGGERANRLFV